MEVTVKDSPEIQLILLILRKIEANVKINEFQSTSGRMITIKVE